MRILNITQQHIPLACMGWGATLSALEVHQYNPDELTITIEGEGRALKRDEVLMLSSRLNDWLSDTVEEPDAE